MVRNAVAFGVVGVKANQVRIGINARRDVAVQREEEYARVQGARIPSEMPGLDGLTSTS